MTKEALKLALEALVGVLDDAPKVLDASISGELYEVVQCREAISAIKEALAQPKQEPVAWGIIASNTGRICQVELDADEVEGHNPKHIVPLYTTPQAQRTWVGLEQSDMPDGADPLFDDSKFIAGMVYAANKLMEKNT